MTGGRFTFTGGSDGWFDVDADDDSFPILSVRVGMVGTRLRILGVKVDGGIGLVIDGGTPITSATLARIPLGQIGSELQTYLADVLAGLIENDDSNQERGVDFSLAITAPGPTHKPGWYSGAQEWATEAAETAAARMHLEDLLRESSAEPDIATRGRGAKPPTDLEYQRFALAYLEELAKGRGAVQRTADRLSMHRTSANRWIRECQSRGLIPQKGE